jgi:hypothetical protein
MGGVSEITAGNITHIKNGRNPDAGASLFPAIPTIQIIAVLFAWSLNKVHENLGLYTILGLFLVFCLLWIPSFLKLKGELNKLKQKMNSER